MYRFDAIPSFTGNRANVVAAARRLHSRNPLHHSTSPLYTHHHTSPQHVRAASSHYHCLSLSLSLSLHPSLIIASIRARARPANAPRRIALSDIAISLARVMRVDFVIFRTGERNCEGENEIALRFPRAAIRADGRKRWAVRIAVYFFFIESYTVYQLFLECNAKFKACVYIVNEMV